MPQVQVQTQQQRDLAATLQALRDSKIQVTWLWGDRVDFQLEMRHGVDSDWRQVANIVDLANAIHNTAVELYPYSQYAAVAQLGPDIN